VKGKCPICGAPVDEVWRQEGSRELPVCRSCHTARAELRETLAERIDSAIDLRERRIARKMAYDFFGGEVG